MNIFFCEKCGFRVRESDIQSGAAKSGEEGLFTCPSCNPASRSTTTTAVKQPSSGRPRRESVPHLPPLPKPRSQALPAQDTPAFPLMAVVGGLLAAGLLVIVLLLLVNKPSTPRASHKPEAPASSLQPPSVPAVSAVSAPPPVTPLPPPSALKPEEAKSDSPRDLLAQRELETVKAYATEHPEDPYGYRERLSQFALRNRTTTSGPEAERLLSQLNLPSRAQRPLAHWKFDEGQGTVARDSAGTNDAALRGQVRFVSGRVGSGAVAFAGGREDYLDLGSGAALNFAAGAPFTVAGWFRTSAEFATLVSFRNSKDESTDLDIVLGYEGVSKTPGCLLAIVRQDGGTTRFGNVKGQAAHDGAWHHFALTRNTEGTIRLFLDGAYQGMHTNAEAGGALTSDLRTCGLELFWTRAERPPDETGQGLNGEMDDLRIYDCELTESEIRELLEAH